MPLNIEKLLKHSGSLLACLLALAMVACVGAGGPGGPGGAAPLGASGANGGSPDAGVGSGTPDRPGQTAPIIPEDPRIFDIAIEEPPCPTNLKKFPEWNLRASGEEEAAPLEEEGLEDENGEFEGDPAAAQAPCVNSENPPQELEAQIEHPGEKWADPEVQRPDTRIERRDFYFDGEWDRE